MSKPPVLSLVDRLPQTTTNRQAIEILRDFLADAEAGKLTSVAIAALTDARVAETASSGGDDSLLLLAAVVRLQDRLSAAIDGMERADGPPLAGA